MVEGVENDLYLLKFGQKRENGASIGWILNGINFEIQLCETRNEYMDLVILVIKMIGNMNKN